jgi:hypothetical protein
MDRGAELAELGQSARPLGISIVEAALTKHVNVTFENTTIALDGQDFTLAHFATVGSSIGGTPPVLDTCAFHGFSFIFAAAAGETLNFMRTMYHGGFQNLVDTTLNSIRKKAHPGQWGGTVH